MAFKTGELMRLQEAAIRDRNPMRLADDLAAAMQAGEVLPTDFSIRQLFEELLPDGREAVDSWNPANAGSDSKVLMQQLLEADAVRAAAFSAISGQIMYTAVMQGYEQAGMPFSDLIPVQQSSLRAERIPGIGGLGDQSQAIGEGEEYPTAGLTEEFIDTPLTTKSGLIIPLTREATFFDRTGLVIQEAAKVGTWLKLNREKRAIDCVIDENRTVHRYNCNGLGPIASYGNASGLHAWDNLVGSNPLVDWTSVDLAEQALSVITDPVTGEPISLVGGKRLLICTRGLSKTAERIGNATEITVVTPNGYATSGMPHLSTGPNPVQGTYDVHTSSLLAMRLATDTDWFYGILDRYARWMQNWPATVVQAPANNHDDFHRDIIMQWKASEMGQYAVIDPRVMVKNTAA